MNVTCRELQARIAKLSALEAQLNSAPAIAPQLLTIVQGMSAKQRLTMLRDVIQNMAERGDAEEIAAFLTAQLGGDDLTVAQAYATY